MPPHTKSPKTPTKSAEAGADASASSPASAPRRSKRLREKLEGEQDTPKQSSGPSGEKEKEEDNAGSIPLINLSGDSEEPAAKIARTEPESTEKSKTDDGRPKREMITVFDPPPGTLIKGEDIAAGRVPTREISLETYEREEREASEKAHAEMVEEFGEHHDWDDIYDRMDGFHDGEVMDILAYYHREVWLARERGIKGKRLTGIQKMVDPVQRYKEHNAWYELEQKIIDDELIVPEIIAILEYYYDALKEVRAKEAKAAKPKRPRKKKGGEEGAGGSASTGTTKTTPKKNAPKNTPENASENASEKTGARATRK